MFRPGLAAGVLVIALSGIAAAQTPTVYATGLQFPAKLILGPNGSLLVTDMTDKPNTGRVSLVRSGGVRTTLMDGLPSGLSAPNDDPDGPTDMALSGRVLYLEIGEGDTLSPGTVRGTAVGNPKGPSSPIFVSILKVTFSADVDSLTAGFSLKSADHYTLFEGGTVSLSNGAGATAIVEAVALLRPAIPDSNAIYRNSHPYGLTVLPSQPDTLYVADAGLNSVWQVGQTSGRAKLLTRFPSTPSPLPAGQGPPVIEAVPSSIRPFGDQLLVSLLSGAPFVNDVSRIMIVDPKTGVSGQFITALSSTIDVLFRVRADGTWQFFTLEFSLGIATGRPGRLRRYESPAGVTLSDTLVAPSSMALDPANGNLYIASKAAGNIVVLNVGR